MSWEDVNRSGKALYDFVPNGEYQLPLKKGQIVEVSQKRAGWFKGNVNVDGVKKRGIFPESYVKLDSAESKTNDKPKPSEKSSSNAQQGSTSPPAKNTWTPVNKSGNVLYNFEATGKFQLGITKGDTVMVIAERAGWYKGYKKDVTPRKTGFFPVTYVELNPEDQGDLSTVSSANLKTSFTPAPPKRNDTRPSPAQKPKAKAEEKTKVAAEQKRDSTMPNDMSAMENNMTMAALLGEIELCMGLWLEEANENLMEGRVTDYQRVQERITTLLELRAQLLEIPAEDMKMDFPPLRKHIIQLIEKSRKMVVGFMVPRNDVGMIADTSNTPIMKLLKLHHEMYQPGDDLAHHFSFRLSKNMHSVAEMINAALGRKPEVDLFQLVVECSMVITTIKEDFHLTFSLWSKATKKAITEEWSLTFSSLGMARDVLKNKTIFADLTMADFEAGLYLVCKVYRNGNLLLEKAANSMAAAMNNKDPKYRRPFFVSMASLKDIGFNNFVEKECTPGREFAIRAPTQENIFSTIPGMVLDNKLDETKQVMEAKQVVVNICMRNATLKSTCSRNDGELEGVVVSRKLHFPAVFNPAEERNDLFVWLNTGKFLQGTKKAALNVQIVAKVFLENGQQVMKSIRCLGNPDPQDEYVSSVYYHNNTPPWDEILSLKVDPELLEKAHIQFVVYHSSTNKKQGTPLSFGWLKLTSDKGAIVNDKKHMISTFKLSSRLQEIKNCKYMHLGGEKNLKVRKGEEIICYTKLLSTLKTHNPTLYPLLKKDRNMQIISHYLKQFVRSPFDPKDMKIFMKLLLNNFFEMLQDPNAQSVHQLVLEALIFVFSNLGHDEEKMLKMYMESVFHFNRVHTVLLDLEIKMLKKLLERIEIPLLALTKSFHWLTEVIVRSFGLSKEDGLGNIRASLTVLCKLVSQLLSRDSDIKRTSTLAKGQRNVIKVLPVALVSMQKVFDGKELAEIAVMIVKSINADRKNDVARLNLLRVLAEDMIFKNDSREVFYPLLVDLLSEFLVPKGKSVDRCYLSTQILKKLIGFIEGKEGSQDSKGETKIKNPTISDGLRPADEAAGLILKFLPVLAPLASATLKLLKAREKPGMLAQPSKMVLALCKKPSRTKSTQLEMDSVLSFLTMCKIVPESGLLKYIDSFEHEKQRLKFVGTLLEVQYLALKLNVFPEVWVVITTLQMEVIAKVHGLLGPLLCGIAKGEDFGESHEKVLSTFFRVGFELLKHRDLRVEEMNKKRRKLVETQFGTDLRPSIRGAIEQLWNTLGERKICFIKALVPSLFDILLTRLQDVDEKDEAKAVIASGGVPGPPPKSSKSPRKAHVSKEMRAAQKMCMDMYYSLIIAEYQYTKTITKIERYTIDELSCIIHETQGRGELFYKILKEDLTMRFKTDTEHTKLPGEIFLKQVGRLFDLMSSLLRFPTTAIYEDERTSNALSLMEYLRKPDENGNIRKEMYFRYVQYLVNLHAELKNYQEAGITQLLEVDMLEWSEDIVEARGKFPREKECERKERLLQIANSFFSNGQDWERAISMCERLASYYRHKIFNYEKLSSVLIQEAELFRQIAKQHRFYPSYYRVCFHGDFPEEVDGSEYVYRGGRMEKVMNFCQRIKRKYPRAKLVMRWDAKPKDLQDNKQVICIVTLKLPSCGVITAKGLASEDVKASEPIRSNKYVTEPVAEYLENDKRMVFVYDKPEQKGGKKPQNEFKDLWVRQKFILTDTSFPTVRRRMKVVRKQEIMVTPIENAANLIAEKNSQLLKEMQKVRDASQLAKAAQASDTVNLLADTNSMALHSAGASMQSLPTIGAVAGTTDPAQTAPPKQVQVNTLSSLLQGTIDAAVNGGTKLFCEAFLVPEYKKAHTDAEDLERIEGLRKMLNHQMEVLRDGLILFGEVCPTAYKPLLDHLTKTYGGMIKQIQKYCSV